MAITLKAGDKAPNFTTINQKGEEVSLEQFLGNKVALFFYPNDLTPTCTTEVCDLRDHHKSLIAAGYTIVGVSQDNQKTHQKFIDKYNLPFDLLVDTDHTILEKYGVWAEKQMFGRKYMGTLRTTFIINEKGIIERVIEKVKSKEHAAQILN